MLGAPDPDEMALGTSCEFSRFFRQLFPIVNDCRLTRPVKPPGCDLEKGTKPPYSGSGRHFATLAIAAIVHDGKFLAKTTRFDAHRCRHGTQGLARECRVRGPACLLLDARYQIGLGIQGLAFAPTQFAESGIAIQDATLPTSRDAIGENHVVEQAPAFIGQAPRFNMAH